MWQVTMQVVLERGLQLHPNWLNKCIQLYETYLVRHGIMLVGPAGSGKSAICECLAAALTELGTKHVIWRMNPKAITAPQMFGRMDAATVTGLMVFLLSSGGAQPRTRTRTPGLSLTVRLMPSGLRT